jgi:hypothetical protein
MNAIGSSQVSPKRAGSHLYSLQIASQNVDRSTDAVPRATIPCITQAENGDEYGPECESNGPIECGKCVGLEKCTILWDGKSAGSAGQAGKPLPTLLEMFNDALGRGLTGLSRERYEMFRDSCSKSKASDSGISLVSLLKLGDTAAPKGPQTE